jgi:hypothetical protein
MKSIDKNRVLVALVEAKERGKFSDGRITRNQFQEICESLGVAPPSTSRGLNSIIDPVGLRLKPTRKPRSYYLRNSPDTPRAMVATGMSIRIVTDTIRSLIDEIQQAVGGKFVSNNVINNLNRLDVAATRMIGHCSVQSIVTVLRSGSDEQVEQVGQGSDRKPVEKIGS